MTLVTQADLAKAAGVSRAAVCNAVKAGRFKLVGKQVDTEDPEVQAYMFDSNKHRMRSASTKVARERKKEVKKGIKQLTKAAEKGMEDADPNGYNPHDLAVAGKALDNRIKEVKLAHERVKYQQLIGATVPMPIIAATMKQISASIDEQFSNFDQRVGDSLYALAEAGVPKAEFREKLADEITRSIKAVVATVKRANRDLIRKTDKTGGDDG